MDKEPLMPVAVADYYSETNWDEFMALWPDDYRIKAPTYAEIAKELDNFMESAEAITLNAHRVKVHAAEWEAWIISGDHPKERKSVRFFAADQLAKERRGLLTRPDE